MGSSRSSRSGWATRVRQRAVLVAAVAWVRAEGDAAALPAGEYAHVRVARGQAHRVHGDLQAPVHLPAAAGVDLVLEPALLRQEAVHLLR